MEFNINVWRGYYDQVQILGQYLKDSLPDSYGNPAKFKITLVERREAEKEVQHFMKLSDKYLDKCRMFPRERPWVYDRNNELTWASSEKFMFFDLMPKTKNITISL